MKPMLAILFLLCLPLNAQETESLGHSGMFVHVGFGAGAFLMTRDFINADALNPCLSIQTRIGSYFNGNFSVFLLTRVDVIRLTSPEVSARISCPGCHAPETAAISPGPQA
jgi:hypothetical protein